MRAVAGVIAVTLLGGCELVFPPADRDPAVAGTWTALAAGTAHTCGIQLDGSLWCWGYNAYGEVGDGTRDERVRPARIGPEAWTQVSAGLHYTCAIQAPGSLWCWGTNTYSQLGSPPAGDVDHPVQVGTDVDWQVVVASTFHTCAIKLDGSLWCWGYGANGELGVDDVASRDVPTPVQPGTSWIAVGLGDRHTCGVRDTGTMWCWGHGNFGQLGLGADTSDRVVPIQVGNDTRWTAVAAGHYHTCGLRAGTAACWGHNSYGQLGDGSLTDSSVPVQVLGDGYRAIDAELHQTCAIRTDDGALECWGYNEYGQLVADDTGQAHAQPVPASVVRDWSALELGAVHTCALTTDHHLWCGGANDHGQLGDGVGGSRSTPVKLAGEGWLGVSAGNGHTCAENADDETWCWGLGGFGQLADPDRRSRRAPVLALDTAGTSLGAGNWTTCQIRHEAKSGTDPMFCWGYDGDGQLGQNTSGSSPTPIQVGPSSWIALAVENSVCGIQPDLTLWCWGDNTYDQLGRDPTDPTPTGQPGQVAPSLVDWTAVAIARDHGCGVADGEVWCWGDNSHGQLGSGLLGPPSPTPVRAMTGVGQATGVAVGLGHSCGLLTDGTIACWGKNDHGQLGDTTFTPSATPIEIAGGSWTKLVADDDSTCALTSAGELFCWGANSTGQVGDGTFADRNAPSLVKGDSVWIDFDTGYSHTCGVTNEGLIYCWGLGENGQLGDDTAWRPMLGEVLP